MGFFLLGRSADDTLSLLSGRTFDSRQDALSELSLITADPDFDAWDDDVLLLDVESGTPVLLVRPAVAAPAVVPPVAVESLPEPGEFAGLADEELVVTPISVPAPLPEPETAPEQEAAPEVELAPEVAPESEVERVVTPVVVPEFEPEVAPEPEPEPALEMTPEPPVSMPEPDAEWTSEPTDFIEMPVVIEPPVAREVLAEPAAELDAEPDELFAAPEADAAMNLRDAIARTTEHMEASGIVAPASIGSAGEAAMLPAEFNRLKAEDESAIRSADDPVHSDVPEVFVVPEESVMTEVVEAPMAADAPEVLVQPLDDAPAADFDVAAPRPEVPAWPWDTPIAEPASVDAIDSDSAEEPATVAQAGAGSDEPAGDSEAGLIAESMGRAAAAPSAFVPYGEAAEAVRDAINADALESEVDLEPAAIPAGVPAGQPPAIAFDRPVYAAEVSIETDTPAADADPVVADLEDDSSDFVMLDNSPAFVPASAAPSVALGEELPPLSSYTCNDCVYVETCPNKDQRLPKDCVSFQWK